MSGGHGAAGGESHRHIVPFPEVVESAKCIRGGCEDPRHCVCAYNEDKVQMMERIRRQPSAVACKACQSLVEATV